MNYIQSMDASLLLWIQNNLRMSQLDNVWKFFTFLGNVGWFWILLVAVLLIYKKTRGIGIPALISLLLNVFLTNVVLKNLFARPRPFDTIKDIVPLISKPHDYSFPSGHTSVSFSVAFICYWMMPKKYGIPLIVLACLITFSRLYLGVHYPGDVLGGFLVGLLSAAIGRAIGEWVAKRQERLMMEGE